jgi:hypothetical protein
MNVAEIAKLVAEENSPTVSFPKKIPIKLRGNCTAKLDISSG